MREFLLRNYSFLTHLVEAIAALTGIVLYTKYKSTSARYFIWFLVYIAVCDTIGVYSKYVHPDRIFSFLIGTKIQKNHWWYNLFWSIGAIMFYAFYYHQILNHKKFKTIIKYSAYGFLIFSMIYYIVKFEEFFETFFPIIDILGAIVIILCTVFYFIELLLSDKILSFYTSINFYITGTIFIWVLIITPIAFYDVYYIYEVGGPIIDGKFRDLRYYIFLFSNLFMYLTFTFALIWCKPENK